MMKIINIYEPVKGIFILVMLLTAGLLTSCSSDDDNNDKDDSSFPREVSITYKVTSATLNAANISFVNGEGGQDQLTDEPLPFTKKINTTVDRFDAFVIRSVYSGENNSSSDIKVEVLIDDKIKDSSNCNSDSGYISCSAEYVFGSEN